MELIRGKTTGRAIDGSPFEQEITIDRESERAFLIKIKKPGRTETFWAPKSQVEFRGASLIIPDWLYEKRQAV